MAHSSCSVSVRRSTPAAARAGAGARASASAACSGASAEASTRRVKACSSAASDETLAWRQCGPGRGGAWGGAGRRRNARRRPESAHASLAAGGGRRAPGFVHSGTWPAPKPLGTGAEAGPGAPAGPPQRRAPTGCPAPCLQYTRPRAARRRRRPALRRRSRSWPARRRARAGPRSLRGAGRGARGCAVRGRRAGWGAVCGGARAPAGRSRAQPAALPCPLTRQQALCKAAALLQAGGQAVQQLGAQLQELRHLGVGQRQVSEHLGGHRAVGGGMREATLESESKVGGGRAACSAGRMAPALACSHARRSSASAGPCAAPAPPGRRSTAGAPASAAAATASSMQAATRAESSASAAGRPAPVHMVAREGRCVWCEG
jgi:hypothetical protein